MPNTLTPADLTANPALATTTVQLKPELGGETVTLRLLCAADAEPLGRYFVGLSEATRRVYGPHRFDVETAIKLCAEINYADTLRFIAVRADGEIIGYFILYVGFREGEIKRFRDHGLPLEEWRGSVLAPSIADAYQSKGLGSLIMPHVKEVARRLGCQRMVLSGGVRSDNPRAQHFYRKHGFRHVGDFYTSEGTLLNHDMIMEL
jgi:ribosomal protein S18 acetylase RimI-like enzyme